MRLNVGTKTVRLKKKPATPRKWFVDDAVRGQFNLSKTRIEQWIGKPKYLLRYVNLRDIKKHLPPRGGTYRYVTLWWSQGEWGRVYDDARTWLSRSDFDELSIGCKDFSVEESKAIYKAAGIKKLP